MKIIMHLLVGVIIFLAQSDALIILELPLENPKASYPTVAAGRLADNRLELTRVNLAEIQTDYLIPPDGQVQMPRIDPISVTGPKRGPVK